MVNPAVIMLERSQTFQVSTHATNHSWDSGDSLEKYDSVKPLSFVHFFWIIPRYYVERASHALDHTVGKSVAPSFSIVMIALDVLNILFLVLWMSHSVAAWIHDHAELWERSQDAGFVVEEVWHLR